MKALTRLFRTPSVHDKLLKMEAELRLSRATITRPRTQPPLVRPLPREFKPDYPPFPELDLAQIPWNTTHV